MREVLSRVYMSAYFLNPQNTNTPLSVSQVLNSHSHVMYILSILLAKYTEIKVSLKSRKTMA